jgi:serine/threonine protein kinase/tetratricopeptide (TPR) repeat protein
VIPDREEKSRPAKVGPYLLERRLGSGGMGAVWRAWDERLQRPVAIKQVRPELRDRPGVRELLRHEAAAAARLNHPAIVHIYDILEEGGADWIVMELVEGETLAEILRDGPLALPQALRLGREIAKGLAKAHSQGIVHRDLKALNVMVTPSGHAKILDFGIAKLTGVATGGEIPGSALFRPGTVVGTPFAMSPEQICGTPLDHRSDLFSFGSLLYEMLTGVSPFLAATEAATLGLVVGQRQPPVRQLLPEVPPELSELVDWLLEKKARMRPQDAREVATVLNAILARQPPRSPGEDRMSSRPRKPVRRTQDRTEDRTISLMPTLRRDAVPDSVPRAADASLGAGERRQVTVVCCGLVEVSGPGTWRTPEAADLAGIMPGLRRVLYEVVTHFQGSSGTALGPQLWIYFGCPRARDDDVERAVLTAHELVDRVRRADWKSRGGSPLALRAGVHSGPAIISKNRERQEPPSLGPTLDVATSIQSVASAGEVLVSEATRRLTAKSFETEGVLPGVSSTGGSTSVFRIRAPLNASEQAFRTSVPLIARDGELDMLRQRWGLVQGGESQVVLISGEGGIGKSTLVHALRRALGGLAPRWLLCYGVTHARSSPFFAVIEMLRRYWLASARSAAEELAILERLLVQYGLPVADDLPILALLLSLPLPAGTISPQSAEARWRTREVLLNLLLQATAELPVILVVEDLHWLDPSSLELIGALLEGAGGASLLVILTFRLDFELPWRHHASWLQLHLSRLTDADSLRLIDQVAGGERLPRDVKQRIVRKADGVPLFVEELSKSCVERGEGAEEAEIHSLPGLLRDSLTARLDRLGSAREVAQLAAVIGRTFSFELLASVSPFDPAALRQDLDVLVRADLLHRRGSGEGATYSFKHVLLQEAALELLLPGDLERLHARVAETLVNRFPAVADLQPELVAFHYTEAGNPEKAIEHWLQAGQRALKRFANLEAREHFRNGLRLVESMPPEPGRDRFEMSLQIGSAHAVIVTRGHSDAEVGALFERALALGRQLGELPLQFQSLLWSFYACRGDLAKAWSLAVQLLKAAKARHDPAGLILGLQELAALQARLGRPASALRALRRARVLCPVSLETGVSLFPGWDAKGHLVCEMARTLCDAGFPDQALDFGRQGIHLAESRESSYGMAMALMYLTFIHLARREYLEASQYAQRMRDLCQQHGFAFLAIHGRFLASVTGARLVPAEDAVVLIGEAIQALDAIRQDHRQAEASVACGMTSEARWLLEEGFEIGRRTGERLGKAELFRLDGALLLAGSDGESPSAQVRRQAEVRLRTAIDEARAVGSLWLELRAATDLGRLLCEEGRSEEAAGLVSGVVDRFEEGEETADFKAATALLAKARPVLTPLKTSV